MSGQSRFDGDALKKHAEEKRERTIRHQPVCSLFCVFENERSAIPLGRDRPLIGKRIRAIAIFEDSLHGFLHDLRVACLRGGVSDKAVGDRTVVAERRFIFGKALGDVVCEIGFVGFDFASDQLPRRKPDRDLHRLLGESVRCVQHFLNAMQIGVSVVRDAHQKDQAARAKDLAVTARGRRARRDVKLVRDERECGFAIPKDRHGVGGILRSDATRICSGKIGKGTETGGGIRHVQRDLLLEIAPGVRRNAKKSTVRGEIFDHRVKERLGTSDGVADRAERGMHQNDPVARKPHVCKLGEQILFGIRFVLIHVEPLSFGADTVALLDGKAEAFLIVL